MSSRKSIVTKPTHPFNNQPACFTAPPLHHHSKHAVAFAYRILAVYSLIIENKAHLRAPYSTFKCPFKCVPLLSLSLSINTKTHNTNKTKTNSLCTWLWSDTWPPPPPTEPSEARRLFETGASSLSLGIVMRCGCSRSIYIAQRLRANRTSFGVLLAGVVMAIWYHWR